MFSESSPMISPAPMVREAVGARSLLTDERRDNPKSFLPSQRYPHSRSVRSAVTEGCSRVLLFSCMALGYASMSLPAFSVRVWHLVTSRMSVVLALLFSCMAQVTVLSFSKNGRVGISILFPC